VFWLTGASFAPRCFRSDVPLPNDYERSHGAKLMIADALHHHQVLSAPKGSVPLALRDDAFGQHLADAGQRFQFARGGGVEIHSCVYLFA